MATQRYIVGGTYGFAIDPFLMNGKAFLPTTGVTATFVRPDQTTFTVNPVINNGMWEYVTAISDLNMTGSWAIYFSLSYQGIVVPTFGLTPFYVNEVGI